MGNSTTAGTDYTTLSGSATFSASASTVDVNVTVTNDSTAEKDESVFLFLEDGTGYAVGTYGGAAVTIADNETPVVSVVPTNDAREGDWVGGFWFSRVGDVSQEVTVDYTVTGTATSGTDYTALGVSVTFEAGESMASVDVEADDDSTSDPGETVILTIDDDTDYDPGTPYSATVNIIDVATPYVTVEAIDQGVEGSDDGLFRFTQLGSLSSSLTVYYSVDGDAVGEDDEDYEELSGSVTFPASEDTVDVEIEVVDDADVELQESVALTVESGTGYVGVGNSAGLTIQDDDNDLELVEDDVAYCPGSSVTIDVFDNDPGAENGTPTISDVTDPLYGTVTIDGDELIYTPTDLPPHGSDFFAYTLTNGLQTAIARVYVVNAAAPSDNAPRLTTDIGEVVKITDNPVIPQNPTVTNFNVVIIGGSTAMRNAWTQSARATYGPDAFIYNDVTTLAGLAAKLAQFPAGSIGHLVLGGHGSSEGVYLTHDPQLVIGWKLLSQPANAAHVQTIKQSLLGGQKSLVDFQCCNYGRQTEELRALANLLNARVGGYLGGCGPWNDSARYFEASPR